MTARTLTLTIHDAQSSTEADEGRQEDHKYEYTSEQPSNDRARVGVSGRSV